MTVAESPRRLTRRDALAALAGAGVLGAIGGGTALALLLGRRTQTESGPTPKEKALENPNPAPLVPTGSIQQSEAQPQSTVAQTPEATSTPEIKKGVLWEAEIGQNPLLPSGPEGSKEIEWRSRSLSPFTWSGDRLFVRSKEGRIKEVDPETGVPLWEWQDRGIVLAANKERIFIQGEENFRIYVLDAQTKEEIDKIYPKDNFPNPDLMLLRYRGTSFINDEVFIRSLGAAVVGTPLANTRPQDGFAVFDMKGNELWQSPPDENHIVSALIGKTLVSRSRGRADLWNVKSGTRVGSVSGNTFTHSEEFLIAASSQPATKKARVEIVRIRPDETQTTNTSAFSALDVVTQIYISRLLSSVFVQTKSFDLQHSGLRQFILSAEGKILQQGADNPAALVGENEKYLFQYFPQPGILRALDKTRHGWDNDEVEGLQFLGESAGNLIFANWPVESLDTIPPYGEKKPKIPKLYAVNPETGKREWATEADIATTTGKLEIVVRPDSLWALGKEIVRIDSKTGRSEKVSRLQETGLHVVDTGDMVFAKTGDLDGYHNLVKLVAFRS